MDLDLASATTFAVPGMYSAVSTMSLARAHIQRDLAKSVVWGTFHIFNDRLCVTVNGFQNSCVRTHSIQEMRLNVEEQITVRLGAI